MSDHEESQVLAAFIKPGDVIWHPSALQWQTVEDIRHDYGGVYLTMASGGIVHLAPDQKITVKDLDP